jgi:hypothetical protein
LLVEYNFIDERKVMPDRTSKRSKPRTSKEMERKATQNSLSKQPKSRTPKEKEAQKRRGKSPFSLLSLFYVIATLIGCIASIVIFYPRITVTISDPVDLDEPFSSSVTITNSGYLPLRSVIPAFGLKEITFENRGPVIGEGEYGAPLWRGDLWYPRDLAPNASFMFALNDAISTKGNPSRSNTALMKSANISIYVS